MALTKLTSDLNIIQKLATKPNLNDGLTDAQLKQKFDEGTNDIKTFINNTLIAELESTTNGSSGADNIGVGTDTGLTGATVKAQLKNAKDSIDGVVLGQIPDGSLTDVKLSNDAGQIKDKVTTLESQMAELTQKSNFIDSNSINIIKTNFKIDSQTAASKNALDQMVIDVLTDETGINKSLSNAYELNNGKITVGLNKILDDQLDDLNNWVTTGTVNLDNSVFVSSPTSAYIGDSGSDDTMVHTHTPQTGTYTIEFQARYTLATDKSFRMYMEDDSGNIGPLLFFNQVAGGLVYFDGATNVIKSTSSNTWYKIKLEIDVSSQTFNVYVDDILETNGAPFRQSPTELTKLKFWTDSTGANPGYIDNVVIGNQANTATIIWNSDTADTTPTEAFIVAEETLNTGSINYFISRNNGITETQCTLETITDISSQPSGTTIVAKVIITGDAELLALGWGWR